MSTNKAQPKAGSAVADRLTRWRAATVPIIDGGPAGMSCALWLHNYGLRPIIIEQESALGGMARRSPYQHDWLLGRPDQSARDNTGAFAGPHRHASLSRSKWESETMSETTANNIEYRGYILNAVQHAPGWRVHIYPGPRLLRTEPDYVLALTKEEGFAKARAIVDHHLAG